MPTMPRISGKAKQIAFDVMGIPANFPQKKRRKKKLVREGVPTKEEVMPQETQFV